MGDKDLTNALARMVDANRKRDEQMEEDQRRRDLRMEELAEANRIRDDKLTQQSEQLAKILQSLVPAAGAGAAAAAVATPSTVVTGALPSFVQFDPAVELWTDYWSRFQTFFEAHLVSEERQAHVFLTNQSTLVYKMLTNLSAQQTPPKEINKLTMVEIVEFMADQFNPQRFVVQERFKFWRKMDRKPGETIPELVARIRGDAGTCDFASIKDPQDEAMRTRFICSINNEAAVKAMFRVKDDELTFVKAIELAQGVEDATAVAKETVYGNSKSPVFYVGSEEPENVSKIVRDKPPKGRQQQQPCDRCGRTGHNRDNCRMADATCYHCQKKGHVQAMCRAKQRGSPPQQPSNDQQIRTVKRVGRIRRVAPSEETARKPAWNAAPPSSRPTNKKQLYARTKPAQPDGGGASQGGRPEGAVSDRKQNRQPYDSRTKGDSCPPRSRPADGKPRGARRPPPRRGDRPTMEKPHGTAMEKPHGEERQEPLNGDRPAMEALTTLMENLVAIVQTTLTPAEDKTTAEGDRVDAKKSTFRVAEGPARRDERRESTSGESSVAGESSAESERDWDRQAGKRRRKRRYRQRRRARSSEAVQWQSALAPSARRTHQASDSLMCLGPDSSARDGSYFGGEGSRNAEKATGRQPLMAAMGDVNPRRRGERAAASERMEFVGFVTAAVKRTVGAVIAAVIGFVGFMIATCHRRFDREAETADVGKKSVSKDDGDRSSPTQMTERQQRDRGMNDGDGRHKGKSAFTSVHCAVRQPPGRVSSVPTFRIAHRDEDEQQPTDGVADKDPGRTTTCDSSAPPQTEEVPSPTHVSPPGNDRDQMSEMKSDIVHPPWSHQHPDDDGRLKLSDLESSDCSVARYRRNERYKEWFTIASSLS